MVVYGEHTVEPPRYFYRVQHDMSFTSYDPRNNSFESAGHYNSDYERWLTGRPSGDI